MHNNMISFQADHYSRKIITQPTLGVIITSISPINLEQTSSASI